MKSMSLLLLVAALISVSAFADKGNISKLFDGKFGRCAVEKDIGNSAYLPDGLTAKSNSSALSVTFLLQHLKCEQGSEGLDWALNARPLDPSQSKDLYGRPITLLQANAEAVLVRGTGKADVLSTIATKNTSEQGLDFTFGLNQILDAVQLSALDVGNSVDTRATFFLRSDVSVITSTGETVVLGTRAGGAYAITMTLKRGEGGEIQVSNLQLN